MIDKLEKGKCTGCYTCANKCPQKCIKMVEDKEGFLYPEIDEEKCIKCNLCEKVCPVMQKKQSNNDKNPIVIAAWSKNNNIRLDSTSGGVFSELAKKVLNNGGYVCGAIYDENWMVKHILTNKIEDLEKIRSSKYIQSRIEDTFLEIKEKLDEGKTVLMCGAPCQVEGLANFLNKDYDNLILCDFICRGVNSPKIFRKYLDSLEKKYKSKIKAIKFKDKTYGWHSFSTRIEFENGKKYIGNRYLDSFMIGYLKYNAFMRPSCYDCQFKGLPRRSDITLADFWGIEKIAPQLDEDKGTSMVLLNSEKGRNLFAKIKENINHYEIEDKDNFLQNKCMYDSVEMTESRKHVLNEMNNLDYDELRKKYFPEPKKLKIFRINISLLLKKIKNRK